MLDAESGDGDDEMLKNGEGFVKLIRTILPCVFRARRESCRSEEYVAHASTTSVACSTFLLICWMDVWIVSIFVLFHYLQLGLV